jgi:hypothetical protein
LYAFLTLSLSRNTLKTFFSYFRFVQYDIYILQLNHSNASCAPLPQLLIICFITLVPSSLLLGDVNIYIILLHVVYYRYYNTPTVLVRPLMNNSVLPVIGHIKKCRHHQSWRIFRFIRLWLNEKGKIEKYQTKNKKVSCLIKDS